MKFFSTIVVLTALTAGFFYWQYRRLNNYGFKFRNVQLGGIDSNGFSLILNYEIENKSMYSATVQNYSFDVFINGIYAGNVKSNLPFHLSSFGTSLLSLKLNVPFKLDPKMIGLLPILKTDISKVVFELRGTLDAKALGFEVASIPISYSTDLKSILS